MRYKANVNAKNPALFEILLDQSGSMEAPWAAEPGKIKKTALADIVNRLIADLAKNCLVGDVVRDRIHLSILGYGESSSVGPAWAGNLKGREVVPISEVYDNPVDTIDQTINVTAGHGLEAPVTKKVNVWITPQSHGQTPMAEAFDLAVKTIEKWINEPSGVDSTATRKVTAFPPIVCNITDGMPDDQQKALQASEQLRGLATEDGSVLLMNIHVSESTADQYAFPVDESDLPPSDEQAKFLYRVSSILPDELFERAQAVELPVRKGCRLLIGNANAAAVIRLLNFASTASQASAPRS